MGLVSEFRDFIIKGNAIDLAVGIIIGAAFGAMVNSLVADVIMPPMGYVMGGADFADKKFILLADGATHPITGKVLKEVSINYGKFVNALIALLVQGFAIFIVVKMINTARKKFERQKDVTPPPAAPEDVLLLREIRDSLKVR